MPRVLMLALFAACTADGQIRAQSAPVEITWTDTDSAAAQRGTLRGRPVLRATLPLTFPGAADAPKLIGLRLDLQPAGPIDVLGDPAGSVNDRGELPKELCVEVEIAPGERASVTATLHGRTDAGAEFTRRATLYMVAEDTTLHLSRAGFTAVELNRLQAALQAGRLTREMFEQRARELLVHMSAPAAAQEPR